MMLEDTNVQLYLAMAPTCKIHVKYVIYMYVYLYDTILINIAQTNTCNMNSILYTYFMNESHSMEVVTAKSGYFGLFQDGKDTCRLYPSTSVTKRKLIITNTPYLTNNIKSIIQTRTYKGKITD